MLVNGKRQTSIPLDNRGLAYGDGLFETIRIHRGHPVLLDRHLQRLADGCARLGLADCLDPLLADLHLIRQDLPDDAVLKILLTRQSGGRGYRGGWNQPPDRIITLHPLPNPGTSMQGISMFISPVRLAEQPLLAGLKHLNRLEQVLASLQWPDDACHEGLMLDGRGRLIEGTRSNLFLSVDDTLVTPDLGAAGVAGVLRASLLEAWPDTVERELTVADLARAREVFFCNSVAGVWPVTRLGAALADGLFDHDLVWPVGPHAERANAHFRAILEAVGDTRRRGA